MRRNHLDLVATMSIALLNIGLTFLPIQVKIIQLLVVLPLVFLVPGYLVALVFFQRRRTGALSQSSSFFARNVPRSLDAWEYLVLSIGLSIAIDIVGGFFLNLFPIGLTRLSWTALLSILTIVLSLVVVGKRLSQQENPRSTVPQAPPVRLSLTQFSLFALASIIVVLTILFSIKSAEEQPYPGFTQFWVLPPQSQQTGCTVQLGIKNFEGKPITYRITVEVNGTPSQNWTAIVLSSQQEWSQTVSISLRSIPMVAKSVEIKAQLYRMDKASLIYRQVHLQLPLANASPNAKLRHCVSS